MKNKPRIRFKGFAEDWEQRKLGDVADVRDGTHDSPKFYNDGFPLVTSKNLKDGSIDFSDCSFISEQDFDEINKRSKVDPGDILFGMIGTIGKPAIVEYTGFAIKNVALIKEGNIINNRFIYHLLSSKVFDNYIARENAGGTQKFIALNQIRNFIFSAPTLAEQNKIIELLDYISQIITLHQRKLEKLKLAKKALLQKLFPKNGSKFPELRFNGFADAWEQCKLSDILKVNSGKDYKHLDQGNIPVYGTGGYMLSVNESLSNIDAIGIGRKGTIDKPQYLKAPFWTVDTLFYLTALDKHSILFLYYLMQLIPWKKFDESTGVPSLSKTTIDNINGYVPSNLKEEELISALFSQLDKSITLHQRKLDKLQEVKKGLLQKMFV